MIDRSALRSPRASRCSDRTTPAKRQKQEDSLQALQHIQDLAAKAPMQTLEAWKVGEHSHYTSGTFSLYDLAPSIMDVSITYALLRMPRTEVHRLHKCFLHTGSRETGHSMQLVSF